ncbi:MAG: hypothetical protein WCS69_15500 [Ignavibacteriaceae bacterium]|jgi:mono/diheme cytochrome c family protein
MKIIFLHLLILLTFAGCSGKKLIDDNQDAGNTAKVLYKNKCGGCHALYPKDKLTPQQWESTLVRMGKKAHLNDKQSELIHKYLLSGTVH